MKFIVPFLILAFITLGGCKNSSQDTSREISNTQDSVSLPLTKAEIKVNGMHCEGCEKTIKNNVKEINGVAVVEASYKDNSVVVSYDSTKTNEPAIVAAIEDAGYKVDTLMHE